MFPILFQLLVYLFALLGLYALFVYRKDLWERVCNNRQVFYAVIGIVVLVAILGIYKYVEISRAMAAAPTGPPPQAVSSIVVSKQPWIKNVHAVGTLNPRRGAELATEESGVVARINFQPGDNVKAGQVLVELDSTVETAELRSAQAQLDLAVQTLQRSEQLIQAKATSQATLDSAKADYLSAKAQVAATQAHIARRAVVAPFDGRVGVQLVSVGEFINPGEAAVALYSLNPLLLDFNLPQRDLSEVKVGQEVSLQVDAFPGQEFKGSIVAIDPQVDMATRNFRIQAEVQNSDERLRPGMYVNASVDLQQTTDLLTIPLTAVRYATYGDSVYVVDKSEVTAEGQLPVARQVIVKLGAKRGDQVAVLEGLQEGQEIVTSGTFKLFPKAQLIINNSLQPANEANPKPQDA